MENNSNIDNNRPLHIPPMVWVLGVAVIAGLIAIFVFKVTVATVASYAFFLFMLSSHLFMHGSHGAHGGANRHQPDAASSTTDLDKNKHSGHTGGCH